MKHALRWMATAVVLWCGPAAAQSLSSGMARCLEHLSDNPDAARAQARDWARHDGGVDAGRCEALALIEMGEAPAAAQKFAALAARLAGGRAPQPAAPDAAKIGSLYGEAARTWLLANEPAAGEEAARLASGWQPNLLEPRLLRARSQYDRGDFAATLTTLQQLPPRTGHEGHDDGNGLARVYILRAAAHRRLNQVDAGMRDVDIALSLSPDDAPALLEHGILQARHGNLKQARSDWDRVIDLSPDTHEAYLARQDEDLLETDPDQPL